MYRVLIADDEPLVRAGIRGSVDWAELGMEVVAEVENGAQALDFLCRERVHILLLDLEMPMMGGLALLRELRTREMRVAVIVIAANGGYDAVRQSMKLGARDYLLKSAFQPEELREALICVRSELLLAGGDAQPLGAEGDAIRDICRLLEGEDEAAESRVRGIFPTQGYTLCCFAVPKQQAEMLDRVYTVLQRVNGEYRPIVGFRYHDRIFALISHTQEKDWIKRYLLMALGAVESALGVTCYAAVSEAMSHSGGLREANEQLLICMEQWFYMRPPKVAWYTAEQAERLGGKQPKLESLLQELRGVIVYNELDALARTAKQVFAYLQQECNVLPKFVKNDFINVVNQCTNVLQRLSFPSAQIDRLFAYTDVAEKSDVFALEEWVLGFFDKYRTMVLLASDEAVRNEAVARAIRYLDERYASHISLKEVAAQANLSVNYFCTLFKKITGMSVVEYLNNRRIEAAKELLSRRGDCRVADVAYAVGFDSTSYFGKMFRKQVGLTAAEYKRSKSENTANKQEDSTKFLQIDSERENKMQISEDRIFLFNVKLDTMESQT